MGKKDKQRRNRAKELQQKLESQAAQEEALLNGGADNDEEDEEQEEEEEEEQETQPQDVDEEDGEDDQVAKRKKKRNKREERKERKKKLLEEALSKDQDAAAAGWQQKGPGSKKQEKEKGRKKKKKGKKNRDESSDEEEDEQAKLDRQHDAMREILKQKQDASHTTTTTTTPTFPGMDLTSVPLSTIPTDLVTETELKQHPKLQRIDNVRVLVKKGFVPNMLSEGLVYATPELMQLLLDEMNSRGSFSPSLNQIGNVAGMPGIVGRSMGMPDIHAGYGFAIGNVCAVDSADPKAVVSPGGVGFDINCGVRLLRTNLMLEDVMPKRDEIGKAVFKHVPVGAGTKGGIDIGRGDLDAVMTIGMQHLLTKGLVWPEDIECTEERGCIPNADVNKVSQRAKTRGVSQLGTMGSGNHYTEVQTVQEIYNPEAAEAMGITKVGQIVVMIHSGSRGLGHQVCTDYLAKLDAAMAKSDVNLNDRQLACAPISSQAGQDYLAAMAGAANFAFCNRSMIAMRVREAFAEVFGKTARELDMHQVYDVCHNVAKFEDHEVNGEMKRLLIHRKGATRAFPPGHPQIPEKYQKVGQPVLIGGSMGTNSYVLTGTDIGMKETFGSTCHGAGREMSRTAAMRKYDSRSVMNQMQKNHISVYTGTPRQLAEEAAGAYKNVTKVVETCHAAGISRLCVKLRPIAVIKG
eukprot:TRINITY_DN61823_c0_g4_i1.p1 TRINITY_DN61823_c0_g4~~TRINITY_DN61823_c0_g4_i1.p1  ORF type:complete len:690 (-),score=128.10 TRINITY_DN61823_c0_g4_i1:56-2125(-)